LEGKPYNDHSNLNSFKEHGERIKENKHGRLNPEGISDPEMVLRLKSRNWTTRKE